MVRFLTASLLLCWLTITAHALTTQETALQAKFKVVASQLQTGVEPANTELLLAPENLSLIAEILDTGNGELIDLVSEAKAGEIYRVLLKDGLAQTADLDAKILRNLLSPQPSPFYYLLQNLFNVSHAYRRAPSYTGAPVSKRVMDIAGRALAQLKEQGKTNYESSSRAGDLASRLEDLFRYSSFDFYWKVGIHSPHPDVQFAAEQVLSSRKEPEVFLRIEEYFRYGGTQTEEARGQRFFWRSYALEIMGGMISDAAYMFYKRALSDSDLRLQKKVLRKLGLLVHIKALELLRQTYESSKSVEIRQEAVAALKFYPASEPAVEAFIQKTLTDSDANIRAMGQQIVEKKCETELTNGKELARERFLSGH